MFKKFAVILAALMFCVPAFAVDIRDWPKSKITNHYGDKNEITVVFVNKETGDEWSDTFSFNALSMWLETLEYLRPDLKPEEVRDIKLKIAGILKNYA